VAKGIIHICCSDSAWAGMRHAVKTGLLEGKKVVGFFDDLSNGPIDELIELKERINWCKKIYIEENSIIFGEIQEHYKKLADALMKIKDEDIYIWYSNNAKEICGMLYILSTIKDKIHNLYTINVSDITYNIGKRNEYTPRAVGEVITERLSEFTGIRELMGFSRYSSLMALWEKLKRENSILRICEGNEVKSVQVDYFDNMILRYTYRNFICSARTVGEVIGKAKNYVSDIFIFWRITELIKEGKIDYRGNLSLMRELKIKKS
jgi:hypothetical protein